MEITFASINRRVRQTRWISTDMAVDGGRFYTLRRSRKWSWMWLLTHPLPVWHAIRASYSATWPVIQEQQLRPHHCQEVHVMGSTDYPSWHEFSHRFLQRYAEDPRLPSTVLYTAEKPFTWKCRINNLACLTEPVSRDFLEQTLSDLLKNVPLDVLRTMWFIHDGLPRNFSMDAWEYLNISFFLYDGLCEMYPLFVCLLVQAS
jgi:hypothetical protein